MMYYLSGKREYLVNKNMDYLQRLYEIHQDFFDGLDASLAAEFPSEGHWEDFLVEPSDEELEIMNRNANDLLHDIFGDI